MQTSESAVGFAAEIAGDLPSSPHRGRTSKQVRNAVLVVTLLVGGFVARSLATDGSDSLLVRWLPWMQKTQVTVFYADASGEYLVPVSRSLPRDQANPQGLVDSLFSGPIDGIGLQRLLPAGTTATSVALDGGTLSLDLSGDVMELSAPLVRRSLFESLRSWPDASEVFITVDGVALEVPTEPLVYFYDEARDMLVATPTAAGDPRDLATAFLAGPGDDWLTGLPTDVTLNSFGLNQDNGLLTLELSYVPSLRRFAVDHPESVRRVLEGLIATMTTAFPQVDAVYLDFEGHATLGLGQCADLLRSAQLPPGVLNDERVLGRFSG